MARITKEQREYIQAEFRKAVSQKANDSIPEALLKKKVRARHAYETEVTIVLGTPGRYRSNPTIESRNSGKTTTAPNPLLDEMNTAINKADKIVEKGDTLWSQIEAEMILGSDDIKKVLADALAKVAKL